MALSCPPDISVNVDGIINVRLLSAATNEILVPINIMDEKILIKPQILSKGGGGAHNDSRWKLKGLEVPKTRK